MSNPSVLILALLMPIAASAVELIKPLRISDKGTPDSVQVEGVEAGPFNPQLWETNAPYLVPDIRFPLLTPLEGKYRNIYAPSAVETPTGYRLFYGAWDGVPNGKDRLYSLSTDANFQTMTDRRTIVVPGTYEHICNVNAVRLENGSFIMLGTLFPTTNNLNKPAFFQSDTTGTNWNGRIGEPYTVTDADIVTINGYSANSDINGMNVILPEDGVYRLYFGDFKNFAGVQRATSSDGKHYTYEALVLPGRYAVNDIKTFQVGTTKYYLMGLHMNRSQLWFALSTNGLRFDTPITLLTSQNESDRFIVAQGWVVRGAPSDPNRKLVGVLYGAGATSLLNENRIFARWFQKKAVFVSEDGTRYSGDSAHGPDRQLLKIPAGNRKGHFELYAEDQTTLIGRSAPLTINSGQTYRLLREP